MYVSAACLSNLLCVMVHGPGDMRKIREPLTVAVSIEGLPLAQRSQILMGIDSVSGDT